MTAPFIMLVDDEVTFVATMAKRLSQRNIETILAYSGEECLEQLKDASKYRCHCPGCQNAGDRRDGDPKRN